MTARNAYTRFKRRRKPDGSRRYPHKSEYACNTCGNEPYQCGHCHSFTCHNCTTSWPPKCDHCQRPANS